MPLAELEQIDKASYDELLQVMALLEGHYRDLCDIEFTIERGKLWMLQTRVGKRTAAAAFRIATQLVDEGLIEDDEALRRVSGSQLVHLMFPQFDTSGGLTLLGRGMSASPGAAVGKAVFDSYTAVKWNRSGEKVILVRRETNPDDLNGMIAAEGILTSRGGKTSHAAVVARGMGKTCVCGAEELDVDTKRRRMTAPDGTVVHEGDVISVDGSSGLVYWGEVPVMARPWWSTSRGPSILRRVRPTNLWPVCTGSCPARTRCGGCGCGRTRTPSRTRSGRGGSAPRASGCAAPSTCSWASGASTSSG